MANKPQSNPAVNETETAFQLATATRRVYALASIHGKRRQGGGGQIAIAVGATREAIWGTMMSYSEKLVALRLLEYWPGRKGPTLLELGATTGLSQSTLAEALSQLGGEAEVEEWQDEERP
jgi:lambda repressor-like predicted transcriptional regulator